MIRSRFFQRWRGSNVRATPRSAVPGSSAVAVERLRMLSRLTKATAGEYDPDELLATLVDAAIRWTHADVGALVYGKHEVCRLKAAAGTAQVVGADFDALRQTLTSATAGSRSGAVRSDDVRNDRGFELSAADFGQSESGAAVVSCLAVPIPASTGENGGLFLAHGKPCQFDDMAEETANALAALAAVAIDKSELAILATGASEAQRSADRTRAALAAIVEHSEDAILSKSLEGVIESWNASAERLFGYTAEEALGRSITMLIPQDRLHEEDMIISGIRAGRRTEHFETLRRRKDGTLVNVSLSISPILDARGKIVGASKIARDISERVEAQERQALLMREMSHRTKNVFALTSGLLSLSARSAQSVDEFAKALGDRLTALARAHALTMPEPDDVVGQTGGFTGLTDLLKAILSPYCLGREGAVEIVGDDTPVGGSALTSLALVFHELATNAAKYGALSSPDGRLSVDLRRRGAHFHIRWVELGGPAVAGPPGRAGFGSKLEKAAVAGLEAAIQKEWKPSGLFLILTMPARRLQT